MTRGREENSWREEEERKEEERLHFEWRKVAERCDFK